jgi:hypothetical protein
VQDFVKFRATILHLSQGSNTSKKVIIDGKSNSGPQSQ